MIRVRQPGIQTTVQDLGRMGWQHLGVPVGGAMDTQAHRIANLLVANDERAAVLECALGGVALQFTVEALVALAGRDVTASLDGTPIVPWRPFRIEPGALLALHTGGRTTIAIAGGIDVPLVLDARGTSLRAGFGGWHGRALKRDDALPIGKPSPVAERIREHLVGTRRTIAAWGAGPDLVPAVRCHLSRRARLRPHGLPPHRSPTPPHHSTGNGFVRRDRRHHSAPPRRIADRADGRPADHGWLPSPR
jgi:antagonist of KipI